MHFSYKQFFDFLKKFRLAKVPRQKSYLAPSGTTAGPPLHVSIGHGDFDLTTAILVGLSFPANFSDSLHAVAV